MAMVFNFGALTLLLLVGAFFIYGFVEFLRIRSSRHSLYHGEAFAADPKRTGPWTSRRSRSRNRNMRQERSLSAARKITGETVRSKSQWRAS